MASTIYADGIETVTVRDGVVRLDFVKIGQVDGDVVRRDPVVTLAISVNGFARMHHDLSVLINRLIEEGVLTRKSENTTK